LTFARSRRSSGGQCHHSIIDIGSDVSGLSSGFSVYSHVIESVFAPRARSAPFVPLCPKVPDLLENQDRWLAFSDDFRALTLLGRQYHRSTAERSFIVP